MDQLLRKLNLIEVDLNSSYFYISKTLNTIFKEYFSFHPFEKIADFSEFAV